MKVTEAVTGGMVHIGRGGWTIACLRTESVPGVSSTRSISHYGDTWLDYLDGGSRHGTAETRGTTVELEDDVLVVDTTTVPDSQIACLAVSGPMWDPNVPAGMVDRFGHPGVETFDPNGGTGEFGNAGPFDNAAPDVYAALARAHGATVRTIRQVRAELEQEAAA